MTFHSDTPSEASMEAARAIIESHSSGFQSDTHDMDAIAEDFALAIDAAEARGFKRGLEDAIDEIGAMTADLDADASDRNRRGLGASASYVTYAADNLRKASKAIRARLSERGEGGANG